MNRKLVIAGFLVLLASRVGAQDLSGIPAAYVDIGLGVRPLGMGGAYVAVAEDENAARWNPAALAQQASYAAGFTYTRQMNLIPYNYLSGSMPMRRSGVGWYAESSGDEVLNENTIAISYGVSGEHIPGLRTAYDFSFGLTSKFRWASFGNNANGGEGQVQGDAWGWGLDLGMYWRIPWARGLSAAVVAYDLLNNMAWDSNVKGNYSETVPMRLSAGIAYRLRERSLFTFDFQPALYGDVETRFAIGVEYKLLKIIALRTGVAQNIGTTRENRDVTLGLGIRQRLLGTAVLEAGIAYLFNDLANTPRVGIAFRW